MGFSADAITHMGYFIPIYRIYDLFKENGYEFVYDGNFTPKQCEASREAKLKDEEKSKKSKKDDD